MQTQTKITTECQQHIRDNIAHQMSGGTNGKYIFRRAGKLISMEAPVVKKITSPGDVEITELRGLSGDIIKKNVQIDCKSFCGTTTAHAIRQEHACTLNMPILFHSQKYVQPNIGMPIISNLHEVITPIEGDLLCIWLSNETIERRKSYGKKFSPTLEADSWFIASEQFLRAHTLILYDWHSSFDCLIPKNTAIEDREAALKKKLFIGNTLMTNGWLKNKLSLEQSGCLPMTKQESEEKYWHLRSEPVSRNWVDVYAAIVLIARYGEVPTEFNVPNNNNNGPRRTQWSLPVDFIQQHNLAIVEPEKIKPKVEVVKVTIKIETTPSSSSSFRFINIAMAADWY